MIAHHTDDLARRMFVKTADENYILARLAFFNCLYLDFFWLSLHAVEKYFKAVLLMNGSPAKNFGHDLIKLHKAVLKLDSRLSLAPLEDPKITGVHWRQQTIAHYLERLSDLGSADNRYALYGFDLSTEDIFKVDQLIWRVRRLCRRFTRTRSDGNGGTIQIDELGGLQKNERRWLISSSLPIEKIVSDDKATSLRSQFLRFNIPFSPTGSRPKRMAWRFSGNNPPFASWVHRLKEKDSETREGAVEVLSWALGNIHFNRRDESTIRDEMKKHVRPTARPSTSPPDRGRSGR